MRYAVCRTAGCSERNIEKPANLFLNPGEHVYCGECMNPCELITK